MELLARARELDQARGGQGIRGRTGRQRRAGSHDRKGRGRSGRRQIDLHVGAIPPATIGYVYNLSPELRDAIRETLLGFDWTGTGLEKEFGPETTKFVPVNYKDDWANTRRIDQVIAESRKSDGAGS